MTPYKLAVNVIKATTELAATLRNHPEPDASTATWDKVTWPPLVAVVKKTMKVFVLLRFVYYVFGRQSVGSFFLTEQVLEGACLSLCLVGC